MKTLQLILAILMLNFSQAQFSKLNISSYNNAKFHVVLDGQAIASHVSDVTITQILAGNHNLLITSAQASFNNQQGVVQNAVIFQGTIHIPENTLTNAVIRFNQFQIESQLALVPAQIQPVTCLPGNDPYDNVYYPGTPNYYPTPQPPVTYYPNAPACQNPTPQPNYSYYPPAPPVIQGPQAMSPAAFQSLKNSINNQWFSSGQMNVFNQAAASNYFTSQQVYELVELFDFDSDQLQVAKKAYTRTVDPQNYFLVSNALEFSSSVNALSAYIASL